MRERLNHRTDSDFAQNSFLVKTAPLRTVTRALFEGFSWKDWFVELEVTGEENIIKPPYVVAANHLGWAEDPALQKVFRPHRIHWMAKAEIFKHLVPAFVFASLGSFPVKRGKIDRDALRTAVGLLKNGKVVGMMPEGTRGREATELKQAKNGTLFLAISAQAPIIPVAVWGTENLLPLIEEKGASPQELLALWHNRPTQIFVSIGVAFKEHLEINFEEKITNEQLSSLTTKLMLEIRDMLPEEYRGFYAEVERRPV